jgi:hypothetical protein
MMARSADVILRSQAFLSLPLASVIGIAPLAGARVSPSLPCAARGQAQRAAVA